LALFVDDRLDKGDDPFENGYAEENKPSIAEDYSGEAQRLQYIDMKIQYIDMKNKKNLSQVHDDATDQRGAREMSALTRGKHFLMNKRKGKREADGDGEQENGIHCDVIE
jgi:hypothetical protein